LTSLVEYTEGETLGAILIRLSFTLLSLSGQVNFALNSLPPCFKTPSNFAPMIEKFNETSLDVYSN
jgi:hypothetical protein